MNKTQITLKICGWSSLIMGGIFFLNPYFYASIEGANFENIAWLRNLGAALISVNGMGALLASSDPVKEKKLYDIVLLASCLETIALSWSTYSWEFSATVQELIIVPLIMAGLVSVLLLIFRPK
ncbi:MAG: hypothetical protein CL851_00925 [Crocinitomicaceae bacterium]|nr:hypothetical protein [Crocinitomicaceae bacterium]